MGYVKANQGLIMVLILVLLALYTLAGTSDRMEPLTVKERQQVVARWSEVPR